MLLNIKNARVEPDEVAVLAEKLAPYTKHLKEVTEATNFEELEASINLPSDLALREVLSAVHLEIERVELKYVFLIGIGGSNLGTKAVYDALFGYKNSIVEGHRPKIIFIDTNNSLLLESTKELINNKIESPEEFLVITISKSGGTTETIVNTEIVLDSLVSKFDEDNVFQRTLGITTEGSNFDLALKGKGARVLYVPLSVGGRYSVLSAVGLLPLLAAQVDIDELLAGALDMRNRCITSEFSENIAMQSAIVMYLSSKRGKSINTNFSFLPELESLLKWYRQLLGESIGKKKDRKGNSVCIGITPEVSIGSTDLHSMAQLYLGGPNDKITMFLITSGENEDFLIKSDRLFPELVPEITGKTNRNSMEAIYEGVKIAYEKSDRAFVEVILEDVSLFELGAFMQFKMIEMMYLGELFDVNPFNQPSVENYKIETKRILKEK